MKTDRTQFLRFLVIGGTSAALQVGLTWALSHRMPPMPAQALAIALTVCLWNYPMHRGWSFKRGWWMPLKKHGRPDFIYDARPKKPCPPVIEPGYATSLAMLEEEERV